MTETTISLDDLEGKIKLKFAPFDNLEQFIRWTRTNFGLEKTRECIQKIRECAQRSKTINVVKVMKEVTRDVRNIDCSRKGIKTRFVY